MLSFLLIVARLKIALLMEMILRFNCADRLKILVLNTESGWNLCLLRFGI